jgi:hypothetical protein
MWLAASTLQCSTQAGSTSMFCGVVAMPRACVVGLGQGGPAGSWYSYGTSRYQHAFWHSQHWHMQGCAVSADYVQ